MTHANIEAYAQTHANEITDNIYYKRLQQELRAKNRKATKLNKKNNASNNLNQQPIHKQKQTKENKKPSINNDYFKDQVLLSSKELTKEINQDSTIDKQRKQELDEKIKYNAHDIRRNFSYKINFKNKKNDLIEMYKYNLQETRSHNTFTARFAAFKTGIVGQLLSSIGVSTDELKALKKETFKELFEENHMKMEDHIYHFELNYILHGQTRKSKQKSQVFHKLKIQLIHQMNNIGRIGFWSKSKLLEENINQCKKIKQEFLNEKNHLEYLLSYINQEKKAMS